MLWNCDFEGDAFATQSGESELIGIDGWYENTNYANRGWDKSWKVVQREGNRVAVGDLNRSNISDVVPKHAVQVRPGKFSVEVEYRRHSLAGNMPVLHVCDPSGKALGIIYLWPGRGDLVAIEQSGERGGRRNFGNNEHGLGSLAAIGQWCGLKLVIDTTQQRVTGYVRSGDGQWVKLNKTPLPYYDREAEGTVVFLGSGSRKLQDADSNMLEMDNIRATQLFLNQ